jgi:ATP-dependent helicase/nuclease subunit B
LLIGGRAKTLRRPSEDDSGHVSWHFELSLGVEYRPERREADPQLVPGAVDLDCGIQLRGSIDLVEGGPAGQVRVTDHKTGKADGKPGQVIDGGKFAAAAVLCTCRREALRQRGETEPLLAVRALP